MLNGIYLNNQLQLQKNQSIYGLGHIENDEIDYLIKKAKNCYKFFYTNLEMVVVWMHGR